MKEDRSSAETEWTGQRLLSCLMKEAEDYVDRMAQPTPSYRFRTILFVHAYLRDFTTALAGCDRAQVVSAFRQAKSSRDDLEILMKSRLRPVLAQRTYQPLLSRFAHKGWDIPLLVETFGSFERRPHRFEEDLHDLALDVAKQVRLLLSSVLRKMSPDHNLMRQVEARKHTHGKPFIETLSQRTTSKDA